MPRTSASNGVKPEIRALSVIQMGVPVTPEAINAAVGTGNYASKYILYLKLHFGFDFTVQKNGRNVVTYTMIKEPPNAATLRSAQAVIKTITKALELGVRNNHSNLSGPKKVLKPTSNPRKVESIDAFGNQSDGEVASYGVERDWDNLESTPTLRELGLDF